MEIDKANSKDLHEIKIYNTTQENTAAWHNKVSSKCNKI